MTHPISEPTFPLSDMLAQAAEPFDDPDDARIDALLERIGGARVVLLRESTRGSSEFYRMRSRITRALIEHHGFDFVAVEADRHDARSIDTYVRDLASPAPVQSAFSQFPSWLWRNREVHDFVQWLRGYNSIHANVDRRVGFHGLDPYSMFSSIGSVLEYLEGADPEIAALARKRYRCLGPFAPHEAGPDQSADPQAAPDPATTETLGAQLARHEAGVLSMLQDLLAERLRKEQEHGGRLADAEQSERVIVQAENYYRAMYLGRPESRAMRAKHMFATLRGLLDTRGPGSKVVVWEHNAPIGDADAATGAATGAAADTNIGQLCRRAFGEQAALIGFGTHQGSVAAADDWNGPMRIKRINPAVDGSYEHLCHETELSAFALPLRSRAGSSADEKLLDILRSALLKPRLQRTIGAIYRPEDEQESHYVKASLPEQFDEYIWIKETSPVGALPPAPSVGLPSTYPFGR